MDDTSFLLLYKTMVRPHFGYANYVWCALITIKRDIGLTEIENIQKRATTLIINFKNMSYTDRLLRLKLPILSILKYRLRL